VKVPLLDLRAQYAKLREEIVAATQEVYESQQFILGPKVKDLEEKIAEYCRCSCAVGVSSGTDALLISLMTEGIGHGTGRDHSFYLLCHRGLDHARGSSGRCL